MHLIAYIPVLNKRHLDWFAKYPEAELHLISQELAEDLDPRQKRNIGAIPTYEMMLAIKALGKVSQVYIMDDGAIFYPWTSCILADENVCHLFVERFFGKKDISYRFESIWARYDMAAIKKQSPIIDDVDVVTDFEHREHIRLSDEVTQWSSDWWRQVGASVVAGRTVVRTHNAHFPTEYSPDIMGDPRINSDAGEPGKYTSFHAEKTAIIQCAAEGIATRKARLYTTVFPCEDCARAIVVAGIKEVYFREGYSSLDALEVLKTAKVKLFQVKDPKLA